MVEAGGTPPRFVVWADRQTRGRGRGSNAWWSDEGSLTVTLVIDPRREGVDPRDEPKLSLLTGLACVGAVEGLLRGRIEIRWPNDVEVDGKKLAGCLVERVETPDGPRMLIGVGINVATRFDGAPPDVRALATSVALEGIARIVDKNSKRWRYYVLLKLMEQIDIHLAILNRDAAQFARRINRRNALLGRALRIQQGARVEQGIGGSINEDGSLVLMTDRGELAIYGGQVLRD